VSSGPALDAYAAVVGEERIEVMRRLAAHLRGLRLVVVNSTRVGGGVAEILSRHVPLLQELGLEVRWEVVTGDPAYFAATKRIHNALQGGRVDLTSEQRETYVETMRANAARLALDEADVVVIHDPQPAPLIAFVPKACPWVWR
jgi:trehalose synthase